MIKVDSISLLWTILLSKALAQTPAAIKWSGTTHGPDGPWYAVDFQIGSPPSDPSAWYTVPCYPSLGSYHYILPEAICHDDLPAPPACRNQTQQPFYDPKASGATDAQTGDSFNPMLPLQANFQNEAYIDQLVWPSDDLPNNGYNMDAVVGVSQDKLNNVPITYPKVNIHPYVNLFSLGSIYATQDVDGYKNTSVFPLFNDYIAIPSVSFGMHMGSVAYKIPPSLYLGGFDQNRAIGPVSSFPVAQVGNGVAQAPIVNISLGTAEGGQVFAQGGKNLLGQPSLQVTINPAQPYMVLPKATCDALAATLPVQFDDRTSLYLWQTSNESYSKIVQGAGYLDFGFAQDKLSIKVPMGLLNLVMEPPLAPGKDNVQYFPCYAQTNQTAGYSLGRAFLQAAFFGVNWLPLGDKTGPTFFLAQAPGPNVAQSNPTVVGISVDQVKLQGSSVDWAGTWHGVWSATDAQSSSPATKLGAGARAGIIVGSIAGAAIVLAGAALFWRRRKQHRLTQHQPLAQHDPEDGPPVAEAVVTTAFAKHDPPAETHRSSSPPFQDAPPSIPPLAALAAQQPRFQPDEPVAELAQPEKPSGPVYEMATEAVSSGADHARPVNEVNELA